MMHSGGLSTSCHGIGLPHGAAPGPLPRCATVQVQTVVPCREIIPKRNAIQATIDCAGRGAREAS